MDHRHLFSAFHVAMRCFCSACKTSAGDHSIINSPGNISRIRGDAGGCQRWSLILMVTIAVECLSDSFNLAWLRHSVKHHVDDFTSWVILFPHPFSDVR